MEPRQRARRPRLKLDAILACLRERIVSGAIPPGGQVPTREDLIREFQVSSVTMQRALDVLMAEGFVHAKPRHGTFVVDHPPHQCHYGLVFSAEFATTVAALPSRLWVTMANEAVTIGQAEGKQVSLYFAVDEHWDSRDAKRLEQDIQSRRLAGLILTDPRKIRERIVSTEIPCVSFNSESDRQALRIPRLTCIDLNHDMLVARATQRLKSLKRQRAAVLVGSYFDASVIGRVLGAVEASGMACRNEWVQGVDAHMPGWGRSLVRLLLQRPPKDRPDCLIVSDDHLVEAACQGVIDAGLVIGKQIDVVAHANFPESGPVHPGVIQLGYPIHRVLEQCIDVLDRRRQGQRVESCIRVEPTFQDELT